MAGCDSQSDNALSARVDARRLQKRLEGKGILQTCQNQHNRFNYSRITPKGLPKRGQRQHCDGSIRADLGEERTVSRFASLPFLFVLLASTPLQAQEAGDPRAGLSLAREVCAMCHAVSGGQTLSPDPEAPTFGQIARVPGMTPLALTVALQTSHETMPNIMLKPDELRNIAAYITSLQDRP
jgi:mono/diheme cytochrome c family protein